MVYLGYDSDLWGGLWASFQRGPDRGCFVGVVCGLALPILSGFSPWVCPCRRSSRSTGCGRVPSVLEGAVSVALFGNMYLGVELYGAMLILRCPACWRAR